MSITRILSIIALGCCIVSAAWMLLSFANVQFLPNGSAIFIPAALVTIALVLLLIILRLRRRNF